LSSRIKPLFNIALASFVAFDSLKFYPCFGISSDIGVIKMFRNFKRKTIFRNGVVDDRRQDQKQDRFGGKLHGRQTRDEGQNHAGQHQKNGRWHLKPGDKYRNRRNHAEQQD
jgi:hypothetical protein